MKLIEIITLIVAFLGLAGALEDFFNVSFSTKLIVLVVVGCLVICMCARRLRERIRVKQDIRVGTPPRRRSKKKMLAAILALGIVCFCLSMAGLLVVKFYAINVEEISVSENQTSIWINGSRPIATKLTVLVPTSTNGPQCSPLADNQNLAQTTIVDWDTLTPYLEIKDFKYPQRQGVVCSPRSTVDRFNFTADPPVLEVLRPPQQLTYQKLFFAIGGVLWIASIVFVILR